MKFLNISLIFLFVFSPCIADTTVDYSGVIKVRPVRFAESGDSLHIQFDIDIRGEALNVRQSWMISPVLTGDGNYIELPYALINGRQKSRHFHRKTVFGNYALLDGPPHVIVDVRKDADTSFTYTLVCPYQLWMDNATLEVKQELHSPAGKKQMFVTGGFGEVELEPREAYQVHPKVNYIVPELEEKHRNVQGQAYLDFPSGRSVIMPRYRRNPQELAKIAEMFSKITNNPDVNIKGVFVEGYASPEGSSALNERLSLERAAALRDHIINSFGIDARMISVSSGGEDWDGLLTLVEESNILKKDKIYSIIHSEHDQDRKEQLLRSLGSVWHTLLNEIFPQLRRVEYQIDFSVKDYDVDQTRDLASRSPEMLSLREILLLAVSYPENSYERQTMFDIIARQFPDDVTARVNIAAEMLRRGEYATAKRYMSPIESDTRIYNNLGVYWLRVGETDKAREYFTKARIEGIMEADHNLHETEMKQKDNELMRRYER